MLHIISPPIAAFRAVEKQGHALLSAGREVHCFIVLTSWALDIFRPGEGGVRPHILQDDSPFSLTVLDLVPA